MPSPAKVSDAAALTIDHMISLNIDFFLTLITKQIRGHNKEGNLCTGRIKIYEKHEISNWPKSKHPVFDQIYILQKLYPCQESNLHLKTGQDSLHYIQHSVSKYKWIQMRLQ